MIKITKRSTILAAASCVVLIGASQDSATRKADQRDTRKATQEVAAKPAGDEQAVRAIAAVFVEAFNKGDADAIAGQFADDARVVDEDGQAIEGKEAIRQRFAVAFQANPGLKVDFTIDKIQFLTPDVAAEEGHTSSKEGTTGEPVSGMYTVLYVKRDGRWKIAIVRDHPKAGEATESPHKRLEELAWMTGEWVDEGD